MICLLLTVNAIPTAKPLDPKEIAAIVDIFEANKLTPPTYSTEIGCFLKPVSNYRHVTIRCHDGSVDYLQMYNLGLSHIPQSFESLVNLRTLDLRNNALKVIPKLPGKLLELNLGDNLFEVLPDIANLKSLKDLRLNNNPIQSISEDFGKLYSLQFLILTNQLLVSLPESFGNLRELRTLYFGNKQGALLKVLPDSFYRLYLRDLYVTKNALSPFVLKRISAEMPDCQIHEITSFTNLMGLNL